MGDVTATYAVKLQDQMSGPAAAAASSLQNLKASIDADQKVLGDMTIELRNLMGGTSTNIAAFRELRDRITAQKAAIAQAQSRYVELGGTFGQVAQQVSSGSDEWAAAASRLPGPLGRVASSMLSIKSAGPLVIASGVFAIAAGLGALAAAALVATGALLRYGIAQADARRSELLRLESLLTLRRHHRIAAGSATEMQGAIDRASRSVALGRDEVTGYATQLYRLGLRGDALGQALEGATIAASVQGERGGKRFAWMAVSAARAGRSIADLTTQVRNRLGGIAQRQLLSLDVQSRKLHESFGEIFSGLKTEGLLTALHGLAQLFSQSTVSGRAFKVLADTLLQPMINGLVAAAPIASRFFKGMVIGALHLTIIFLRLRNRFRDTFAGSTLLGSLEAHKVGMYVLFGAVAALAGIVGAAAVAFTVLGASLALLAGPFLIVVGAGVALGAALRKAVNFIKSIDLREIGFQMVMGLTLGIERGRLAVVAKLQNLAQTARAALKSALGIASPSKVFARLGIEVPRGFAVGVDAGRPVASRAVDRMVSVPAESAPERSGGGLRTLGRGDISMSVGDIHVHTTAEDPRGQALAIRDELVEMFRGLLVPAGAQT